MKDINYKVIFKGWNDDDNSDLVLTFKKIKSGKKITLPSKILSDLKESSEKNPIIVVFQNIEDVLATNNDSLILKHVNYHVVLFTSKIDGKREGFLIGSEKKGSDLELLGMWPFNTKNDEFSKDQILKLFSNMITVTKDYDNICVISS